MLKLGILIASMPERKPLLDRLILELEKQRRGSENVQIIISTNKPEKSGGPTTGAVRNRLMDDAVRDGVQYIAFFDDDDMPGPTYIQRGLEVADSGLDCGELFGQIYFGGKPGMPFHHYLGCTHAWQDNEKYHRPPNHLNTMKLDLVKGFRYEDKTFGEDMCFAMELKNKSVFKTMHPVKDITYHYFA